MLVIEIPNETIFNEKLEQFEEIKGGILQLEHSLVSLRKWEQRWHKPFLATKDKTTEELIDYIKCMTINSVNDSIYRGITQKELTKIIDYIRDPMTATWFSKAEEQTIGAGASKNKVVTAEVIYYWMIALNIPVEFQKWHLNSLLTLIKVVNLEEAPKKKMNQKEAREQQRALNAARRQKHKSKG